MAEWLKDRRESVTQATVDRYEYILGKYIVPVLGGEDMASISSTRVNVLVAGFGDKEKG